MSLKSIDMQLAVHKNPEAGMKQNEIQQKPVHDQDHLANQAEKNTEKERSVTAKSEAAEQAGIRDQGERGQRRSRDDAKAARSKSDKTDSAAIQEKPEHPYKGKFIDLQL